MPLLAQSTISLEVIPRTGHCPTLASCTAGAQSPLTQTDETMWLSRSMLQSTAYFFTQGQLTAFEPDMALDLLKASVQLS